MKKELEVLFLHPPLPANSRHKRVFPLGLAYLASYLRNSSSDVRIEAIDAHVLNMRYEDVLEGIKREKRDIVAITFWTAQAPFVYALAKEIKEYDPETVIIFGGIHTTCCPEEAATYADYCILHEGEETFRELIENIQKGAVIDQIKGIGYFKNNSFIKTLPRPFIEDLDSIPFPAWDIFPMERYNTFLHVIGGMRVPLVGSRGCSYNCSYCVSPFMWKQNVRWRSPDNIILEMKIIMEKYNIRQFHFWDDNLLMNKPYIKELCEKIIDNKLDIKWVGLSRGSHIIAFPEVMKSLKDSGCVGLEVGIESVDENTFRAIQKEEEVKELDKAFRLQKEAGLYPLFTYMALNPGENINTYYVQAKFIDNILSGLPWCDFFHPLDFPIYVGQFCTPHVGTKLYEQAKELGVVIAEGWQDYNHHTVNFLPNSLLEDIPEATIKALRDIDYIICTKAAWGWIYQLYSDKEPIYSQIAKRSGFICFVRRFFYYCRGRFTIREIIKKVGKDLGISHKKSSEYTAITVIVLSQLGIIRSAVSNIKNQIKLKTVVIPDYVRIRRKYRILKFLSFFIRKF